MYVRRRVKRLYELFNSKTPLLHLHFPLSCSVEPFVKILAIYTPCNRNKALCFQFLISIRISRKCLRIVYQNIAFALGVKGICLVLGALGIANMWLAIFADVGVMVLAVLNAIRALFVKNL